MGKGNKQKKQKGSKSKYAKQKEAKKKESKITLDDIAAMSDSDDEGGDLRELLQDPKVLALKSAIESGKFDKLLDQKKGSESESEIEEVELGADDSGGENDEDEADHVEAADDDEENDAEEEKEEEPEVETEEVDQSEEAQKARSFLAKDENDDAAVADDDDNASSGDDEEDDKASGINQKNTLSAKALEIVTQELASQKAGMPWAETFDVTPDEPLPFGVVDEDEGVADEGEEEGPLDVHDDLKREVVFYNMALEAVKEARSKCREAKIPFSRPDDFFAEMVKTDEHMARVKDRLIFDGKKIEAVAQRKANKEHKLRSKESQANKLAEKSKRKRDHFRDVDDWAKSAAQNRGGALDDGADDTYLTQMGKNKKRLNADKKFGFGGKRGRFKQNDRAALNDTSSYNPRGNFGGMGTKKTNAGGGGDKRRGKRARDSSRARKS